MIEAGIVASDQSRSALQRRPTLAGLMLTTEVMISLNCRTTNSGHGGGGGHDTVIKVSCKVLSFSSLETAGWCKPIRPVMVVALSVHIRFFAAICYPTVTTQPVVEKTDVESQIQ